MLIIDEDVSRKNNFEASTQTDCEVFRTWHVLESSHCSSEAELSNVIMGHVKEFKILMQFRIQYFVFNKGIENIKL